jgi:uncharacterized protein YjiS (DUF1127 family)
VSCGSATCNKITLAVPADRARGPSRRVWTVVIERFARVLAQRRHRRVLLDLDDRTLRDVGLTRDQVVRAAMKSPWR